MRKFFFNDFKSKKRVYGVKLAVSVGGGQQRQWEGGVTQQRRWKAATFFAVQRRASRRIESYKNDCLTVEELVDCLHLLKKKPSQKKPKETAAEQFAGLLEAKHITNRQSKQDGDGESSTTAPPESEDSYSSSEETEPSSSSDAIYGEKLEEKPDLMKSMLRHTYNQQANNTPMSKKIEYEVVHDNNDEKRKKIDMSKGGQRRSGAARDPGEKCPRGEKGLGIVMGMLTGQVRPVRILFHGPPGCGKTKLAHAIANETGVPFYKLSATELWSIFLGIRKPAILAAIMVHHSVYDSSECSEKIDAIASKRENLQREMERRIVTQLMTCMDESHRLVKPDDAERTALPTDKRNSAAKLDRPNVEPGYVLAIGATTDLMLLTQH
ncbi:hypothetical protein HAX54_003949 [Datura stramonium]|uniref:ATPase AAA-type core domain-containing protein n=1 Tax=Datura stramonium TaxID=4076 RepID=A0ABS8RTL9_DATST|nr:hypothetical protein [Datura stramonium]